MPVFLWLGSQYGVIQFTVFVFGGLAMALVPGSMVIVVEAPQTMRVSAPIASASTAGDLVFDHYNSQYLREEDLEPSILNRVFGGFRFDTNAGDPFTAPSVVIRMPILLLLAGWIAVVTFRWGVGATNKTEDADP